MGQGHCIVIIYLGTCRCLLPNLKNKEINETKGTNLSTVTQVVVKENLN